MSTILLEAVALKNSTTCSLLYDSYTLFLSANGNYALGHPLDEANVKTKSPAFDGRDQEGLQENSQLSSS